MGLGRFHLRFRAQRAASPSNAIGQKPGGAAALSPVSPGPSSRVKAPAPPTPALDPLSEMLNDPEVRPPSPPSTPVFFVSAGYPVRPRAHTPAPRREGDALTLFHYFLEAPPFFFPSLFPFFSYKEEAGLSVFARACRTRRGTRLCVLPPSTRASSEEFDSSRSEGKIFLYLY